MILLPNEVKSFFCYLPVDIYIKFVFKYDDKHIRNIIIVVFY